MQKTLFVSQSGRLVDLSALEDLFATVGDIESTKLVANPSAQNFLNLFVVEMSTSKQAYDCAERFHGYLFDGQPLSVKLELPTEHKAKPLKTSRKGRN